MSGAVFSIHAIAERFSSAAPYNETTGSGLPVSGVIKPANIAFIETPSGSSSKGSVDCHIDN